MKKKHLILLGIVLVIIVIPVVSVKVYNTLFTDDLNHLYLSYTNGDANSADKLRELGELWLSLDDQLTLEHVELELEHMQRSNQRAVVIQLTR